MSFRSYHEQDFYELLELSPRCSKAEIVAAYQRLKNVFGEGSSASYQLFGDDESEAMRERIEEAYETLFDERQRLAYNSRLGIEPDTRERERSRDHDDDIAEDSGVTPQTRSMQAAAQSAQPIKVVTPVQATPPPARTPYLPAVSEQTTPAIVAQLVADTLPDTTEYSGGVLMRLRESRGITLESIAQRTKISQGHLRAIEANQYDKLPARVYVRGFVAQYARCLGLQFDRVSESYLQIYDRFFQSNEKK